MKRIINPLDKKVYFTFKGTTYSVEANDSTDVVDERVAAAWLATHQFLLSSDEAKAIEVTEDAPEAPESPVEEVKEEEVKKPRKSKKSKK